MFRAVGDCEAIVAVRPLPSVQDCMQSHWESLYNAWLTRWHSVRRRDKRKERYSVKSVGTFNWKQLGLWMKNRVLALTWLGIIWQKSTGPQILNAKGPVILFWSSIGGKKPPKYPWSGIAYYWSDCTDAFVWELNWALRWHVFFFFCNIAYRSNELT